MCAVGFTEVITIPGVFTKCVSSEPSSERAHALGHFTCLALAGIQFSLPFLAHVLHFVRI